MLKWTNLEIGEVCATHPEVDMFSTEAADSWRTSFKISWELGTSHHPIPSHSRPIGSKLRLLCWTWHMGVGPCSVLWRQEGGGELPQISQMSMP